MPEGSHGGVGERRPAAQERHRPLEAQQPRERLRRHADLAAEALREVTAAPPGLRGQRLHACGPVRADEARVGVADLRRQRRGLAPGDEPADDVAPRRPVRRLGDPLGQLAGRRQDVLERDGAIEELGHRDAQQAAGDQRRELELQAGLLAAVARHHRPVVQARREGPGPAAVDPEVRAERQDDHHAGQRDLPAARRRAALGEAGEAQDPRRRGEVRDGEVGHGARLKLR
jgi:hypothetical protein